MSDSGFIELKVDYPGTNSNGVIGKVLQYSDVFFAGGHTWRVNYHRHGYRKEDNGEYDLSIYLELVSKICNNVKAIFDVFLMGTDGQPSSSHAKRLIDVFSNGEENYWWGWPQFMKRTDLKSYVMDGKVRIMCVVIVLRDGDNPVVAVPPSDIGAHLGGLLHSLQGTDVSFVVGGEKFPAHRAVLAARSPVFLAQLLGNMSESTSRITLRDIEPATFRALLRFIYTDELAGDHGVELEAGSPTDALTRLLVAADRYALDRLKLMCAQKLVDSMTAETVADILACAETNSCPELKKICIDFFAVENNFKKAVFTDGFAVLVQKFPLIADELKKRVEKL
ncbi:hypothetical protein GUJ93_ZPchr0010g10499 [Zizania palustris]|uniref:BTB/POZ domain containing protein n=1 Tax=Zizania palustris TaxID=103762 RepID=A0A8J5WGE3_ZIZPA|nr:hypothetical protein GUJ93_ZPchr0010g10499 [Zizania palustris]